VESTAARARRERGDGGGDPREEGREDDGRDNRESGDSWLDALVTLLAVIVFGLGCVLVELERAEPPLNRYDAAESTLAVAALTTAGLRGNGDEAWTELAVQRSNR
jgi:hypothetical protein